MRPFALLSLFLALQLCCAGLALAAAEQTAETEEQARAAEKETVEVAAQAGVDGSEPS